jgi:hypothetical protein
MQWGIVLWVDYYLSLLYKYQNPPPQNIASILKDDFEEDDFGFQSLENALSSSMVSDIYQRFFALNP